MSNVNDWPNRRVFVWQGYQELSSNSLDVRQAVAYGGRQRVFDLAFRDTQHGAIGHILLPKDDAVKLAKSILAAVESEQKSSTLPI